MRLTLCQNKVALGDICLNADNRFYAVRLTSFIGFNRPVHISVVREGQGRHFMFLGQTHHFVHLGHAVKEGVMGVECVGG